MSQPSATPPGMNSIAHSAAGTTITITSFSTPAPTSTSQSSPSSPSSSPQRKFAGVATGAAVGGFLLTCILGWAFFLVWKRRHPHRWHGGRHRPPADFGWRRAVASKLKETGASDKTRGASVDKTSSSPASSAAPGQSYITSDDGRPSHGRQESSGALFELPSSSDLLQQSAATNAVLGDTSALAGAGGAPRPDPENTAPPKEFFVNPVETEPNHEIDLASQSSQSSHYTTVSNQHVVPGLHSRHSYRGRTPSPTHRRNNSQGSITFGPNSSSWHGHSSQSIPRSHVSWHGPIQQQYARPPSSWNGHNSIPLTLAPVQPTPRHQHPPPPPSWSVPLSAWTGPPPSPSWSTGPPIPFPPPSPVHSRHSQPPSPILSRSIPNQPKFFFNSPTPLDTPLPLDESVPPSPALEPPRKLTVTNPDASNSPAISVIDLHYSNPVSAEGTA